MVKGLRSQGMKVSDTHLIRSQVLPKDKERAPTYLEACREELRKELADTLPNPTMSVGPVVDSAATIPVVCSRDVKYLTNVTIIDPPMKVGVGSGTMLVHKKGDYDVGSIHVEGACVMPECPESVLPTKLLTQQGYTVVQDDVSGSMIKDGEVTVLIPDGKGMMHVPVGVTKKAVDAELQISLVAHKQEHSEQARREYIRHHKKVHPPPKPSV